ncbi:hypothetical protein HDC36_003403 [Xanthomonas sp. JAI131]|uniref:hypothetical protein n=1 Tax=Xanthomonas sp. JAI131 TaxID=2723067 RepID=UPI0015CB7E1E|nr:hypothetical protein [Xanthomonas sp. JAI131]NYF21927.1 hypothetical protein [Xanthomonas sp. JAI131]
MHIAIPVHYGSPDAQILADELRLHGIAVVSTTRTAATRLAGELEAALGIDSERESEEEHLIHLSCAVEPMMEYGWMDCYVYGQAFGGDISDAKRLMGGAVRQWGTVGKPARHLAVLRGQAS